MNLKNIRKYWHIGFALLIMACVIFGSVMTVVGSDKIGPILIPGNDPSASDLYDEYGYGCENLTAFKINQQNPNGTFSDGTLTVTVSTPNKYTGLSFTSNLPVFYVYAKGGSYGNLYMYPEGVTSDSGILAPLTGGTTGPRADISHITFYYCPLQLAARISIGPDGINPVGTNHEFIALVEMSLNNGPWVPAVGVNVTFDLSGVGSACPGQSNPVTTDAEGKARFSITSAVTGAHSKTRKALFPVVSRGMTARFTPTIPTTGFLI